MTDPVNDRLKRMGLLPGEDFGGARPVARIEYVSRFLFDEQRRSVVALIQEDRIQVSTLYTDLEQREAVSYAISLLLT